jgi:hypothetical protein
MKRNRGRATVMAAASVLALGLGPILWSSGQATAAGSTCGTVGVYGIALNVSPTGSDHYEGASANILNQNGDLCSSVHSNNNVSAGWTMLTDGPDYIQTGFTDRYGISGSYFFGQVDDLGTISTQFSATAISGSHFHHYWEEWRNVTGCVGCVQGFVDGDKYVQTTNNPRTSWGSLFNQYAGETHYLESDVPGLSTSKTHYEKIQPQLYDSTFTDTLDSTSFTNDNTSRWSRSAVTSGNGNGNEWYFWTSSP